MRTIITLIFLIITYLSHSQDTTKYDIIIYKNEKIIQKEFKSSRRYVKIVYQYDERGILIRRWWYDKNNNLIGVSLEN